MSKQSKRNYQNTNKQVQNNQQSSQYNQSMNHTNDGYPLDSMNDLYESYSQSSVKRSKNSQRRSGAQNKNINDCR